jgi:hypothetical protein
VDGLARRGILAAATAAAALGALAGHAAGAPALVSPAPNAVVDTLRPQFSWTDSAPPAGTVRYEVHMTAPSGTAPLATVPATGAGAYAAVGDRDLPLDTSTSWFVRAVNQSGTTIFQTTPARVVRASPPPALSGPTGLVNQATQVFSWTRPDARTASTWTVLAGGAPVQEGVVTAAEQQLAVPAPLADGAYQFRVVQRVVTGAGAWDAAPAVIAFSVDTTPPALLAITGAPPFPTTDATPTFSWTGVEPGARQSWRVIGVGGGVLQGPADGSAGAATVGPLAPGSYAFEVRQQDAAGNAGDWRSHPFTVVTPPPTAAPPAVTRLRLPARNAKRLKPRAGARVKSLRPVLRWPTSRRATVYNVQLFVAGPRNRLRKVHSAFPRSPRLQVPRRELRRGKCYVWRVWPFIGKTFTKRPLGVSNFCVTATRR